MRVALGAGRGRIVLQLLTEGVVLALVSVPLGVVLAVAGIRLIWSQIPPGNVPYYIQFAVDGRSLAYASPSRFRPRSCSAWYPRCRSRAASSMRT